MTEKKSPLIAAVLSFLIPGARQAYSGEVRKGLGFFLIGAMFAILDIFLIQLLCILSVDKYCVLGC